MKNPFMKLTGGTTLLIMVAAGLLALAVPLRGQQVIYSQSSDFPNSSAIASQTDTTGVGDSTTAYDNFTLINGGTISGITWRGGYVLPALPVAIGSFTVTFYGTTAAGEPDSTRVLSQDVVPGSAGETLVGTNASRTIRMFDYQLTLPTPFVAGAGTNYWMSIVMDKAGTLPQWGWGTGTGGDGIMYGDTVSLGGAVRHRFALDLAFSLLGTNAPPPPNTPPVLAAISNQTVYAGTLLSFQASATDTDRPPQTLTFNLEPGYPAGASITTGGLFSWTPAVGPATVPISIKVADSGSPSLSATQSFTVFVLPGNTPPVLAAIPNQTVTANSLLSFTASATDTDQPPQTLTFSLEPGYPTGASITPVGVFSWTPTSSQAGSFPITVKVVDDGIPSLSATQTFTVDVLGLSLGIDVGDIVAADYSDSKVFKFNPASGALQFLGNFTNATDVALATNGNLYISEGGGAIQCLNLKNGTVTRVNTNTAPVDYWGITIGPAGDLFVANSTEDRIVRIDPLTGAESVLSESNLLSSPYGIEFLDAGHLVVSSLNNARIVSIALADGSQTLIAETNGLVTPWGVAVQGTNLYVGDPGAMSVFKISNGAMASLWTTPVYLPSGVAVETNGNILAGSASPGAIVRLDPQGNVLNTYSNALLTMVAGIEVSRFQITPSVSSNTPPVLAFIPDQSVTGGTLLSFTATATDAEAPPQILTFSLLPGAPPGATISSNTGAFTWTAPQCPVTNTISVVVSDNGSPSLSATQSFTVRVTDTTPPVVTLNGANPMTNECHTAFTDPGATAADTCAGTLPVTVTGSVDTNTPGSYTLTYSATDPSGNTGSATRTVYVVDTTPPVVTLNGANPMTVWWHTAFADPGASAADTCAGTLPVTVTGSVDTNTLGSYTLTYSATDPSGNTGSAIRTVNVVDNHVPMTILRTPTNTVVVSWPAPSTGYTLQQNSALGTTNWVDATNTVNVVGNQKQVIISSPAGNGFYRLFHP